MNTLNLGGERAGKGPAMFRNKFLAGNNNPLHPPFSLATGPDVKSKSGPQCLGTSPSLVTISYFPLAPGHEGAFKGAFPGSSGALPPNSVRDFAWDFLKPLTGFLKP